MILSVSRRTDIPACYPEWFMDRIAEGFVMVRNPFNHDQIRKVCLSPGSVDCIVFWTKNAGPLMEYLPVLDDMGYRYMFQYTITPYGSSLEKNLPDKNIIVENLLKLSEHVGNGRLVWRYDPICMDPFYDPERHINDFEKICHRIHDAVDHVIISFMDMYRKNRDCGLRPPSSEEISYMAIGIGSAAASYGLSVNTCCEAHDLLRYGISKGACIDAHTIEKICGHPLSVKKSAGQRADCLCAESIDIGTYNTCTNGCVYCYATDPGRVEGMRKNYHEKSPLLCGRVDR